MANLASVQGTPGTPYMDAESGRLCPQFSKTASCIMETALDIPKIMAMLFSIFPYFIMYVCASDPDHYSVIIH